MVTWYEKSLKIWKIKSNYDDNEAIFLRTDLFKATSAGDMGKTKQILKEIYAKSSECKKIQKQTPVTETITPILLWMTYM